MAIPRFQRPDWWRFGRMLTTESWRRAEDDPGAYRRRGPSGGRSTRRRHRRGSRAERSSNISVRTIGTA